MEKQGGGKIINFSSVRGQRGALGGNAPTAPARALLT